MIFFPHYFFQTNEQDNSQYANGTPEGKQHTEYKPCWETKPNHIISQDLATILNQLKLCHVSCFTALFKVQGKACIEENIIRVEGQKTEDEAG